jgi:hypothetical protein
MTAETNKLVMRRFLEFINTASEKLAQELISPDAIFHVPGRPEPMRGPAGTAKPCPSHAVFWWATRGSVTPGGRISWNYSSQNLVRNSAREPRSAVFSH